MRKNYDDFPPSTSMYLIRSARSLSFFKPAKTIFVPGIYFFGSFKYSNKVSRVQTTPYKRIFGQLNNTCLVLISGRIVKSGHLSRFSTNHTHQRRSGFGTCRSNFMALGTSLLENLFSLLKVAFWNISAHR